jgi:hypothetical protein
MNKASTKAAARSKPAKKRSKPLSAAAVGGLTAKKSAKALPAKKRSKPLSAAGKTERFIKQPASVIAGLPKPRPQKVPLAEVEVLAAVALKKIKAARKLPADEKAWRLAEVADTLERARGWGGLSKDGAWWLKNAHVPTEPYDIEAVLL